MNVTGKLLFKMLQYYSFLYEFDNTSLQCLIESVRPTYRYFLKEFFAFIILFKQLNMANVRIPKKQYPLHFICTNARINVLRYKICIFLWENKTHNMSLMYLFFKLLCSIFFKFKVYCCIVLYILVRQSVFGSVFYVFRFSN